MPAFAPEVNCVTVGVIRIGGDVWPCVSMSGVEYSRSNRKQSSSVCPWSAGRPFARVEMEPRSSIIAAMSIYSFIPADEANAVRTYKLEMTLARVAGKLKIFQSVEIGGYAVRPVPSLIVSTKGLVVVAADVRYSIDIVTVLFAQSFGNSINWSCPALPPEEIIRVIRK